MAAVMAGNAIDGFVVRPLITSISEGRTGPNSNTKRVSKLGSVIFLIIAVLAGLAEIFSALFKD